MRAPTLFVALMLAACAPHLQAVGEREASPRLGKDAVIAGDGTRLPLHAWLPQGEPRGVLLGIHGFNDYGNAFAIPAARWTEQGYAVYAYDQRGFGAAPAPGTWPGVAALVDDLDEAARAVAERHPNAPLTLVGVSMGGAVAMAALADGRAEVAQAAVLVGPAVWGRESMNWATQATLWLVAHTMPALRLTGRGLNITPSDNIDMLRALGADPLVIKRTRVDAMWGVVNLMDAALAAAPVITRPLLVLYGARDEIIPEAPTRDMLCRLNGHHRVAVYPEGYHMLLRDLQAGVVHDDIAAWVEASDAALPSGTGADGWEC
ncbi:MAG: alpha/beta hydrolase [Alphaproteobacteria bacterium]|nr:alpha/beta hydrolase [Alphaproteobacteria bacterium]